MEASDDPFYASLLLYSYRFYENSTMNKTDLYGNAKFPVRNQTEDSGTTQINSIYIKNRHDRWDAATVAPSPASTGTWVTVRG